MNIADGLSEYYAELIEGTYNCVDRVVLNAYFPLGQSGGGFRTWWRLLRGSDAELDDAHLREMAGTFARRLRAYCEKEKIVFLDAGTNERQHELAAAHLRGKLLQKVPELLERMEERLVRFLNTVQAAHVSFLEEPAFDRWTEPTQRGHRRLAGVDLNKARNRNVVTAVVALATKPDGFTVGELAQQVQERTGQRQYAARNAAYDLAKLRGKDLVSKNDHGRRYQVEPKGLRGLCAYVILRDKVIRPVLAGVLRRPGRPPKIVHPIDEHYGNLRAEMNRTFATLGIAA